MNSNHNILHTNDEPTLITIAEVNNNITYRWKIQAAVTCEYSKRTFMNTHGSGEVSNWDLTDQSGSITLVAFNLNSHLMSNKLEKDKVYEFTNLSVRPAPNVYKTLPHDYQLVCNNATRIEEISLAFNYQQIANNFIHLNQVNDLLLNSIIDVRVHVIRDYGISTGIHNDNEWARRDLHVSQDETHLGVTLWNNQARLINHNMAGLDIQFKNVKISCAKTITLILSFITRY
ncbi:unnamed protein product [Rotaria sordida]|uniref:Uncharacterized protein n=1 Tax=Rotaria sordida TaxID=392033 RepID=A0A819NTU4_9BILA|nr:unnamed protein product [Rotaria sordida]